MHGNFSFEYNEFSCCILLPFFCANDEDQLFVFVLYVQFECFFIFFSRFSRLKMSRKHFDPVDVGLSADFRLTKLSDLKG
jgi:hypothetical protein